MKKYILKLTFGLLSLCITSQVYAGEVTVEQIGNFLCSVQLCKNEAVISYIKTSKYNFPNAAEAITCADQKYFGSGCESAKQMLKLSFRLETQNKESVLNYTDCNLIVTSPTEMSLSSCKISGTLDVILNSK